MKKITLAWRLIAVLVPAVIMFLFALLLFFTHFGVGMPIEVKIGMPIVLYIAYVIFIFKHK